MSRFHSYVSAVQSLSRKVFISAEGGTLGKDSGSAPSKELWGYGRESRLSSASFKEARAFGAGGRSQERTPGWKVSWPKPPVAPTSFSRRSRGRGLSSRAGHLRGFLQPQFGSHSDAPGPPPASVWRRRVLGSALACAGCGREPDHRGRSENLDLRGCAPAKVVWVTRAHPAPVGGTEVVGAGARVNNNALLTNSLHQRDGNAEAEDLDSESETLRPLPAHALLSRRCFVHLHVPLKCSSPAQVSPD